MRYNTKRDWSKYNVSMVKRDDMFLWFDEETWRRRRSLKLIRKIGKRIGSMRGDGAYDKKKVYNELCNRKSKACIPARSNARVDHCGAFGSAGRYRNEAIIAMRNGDLDGWKERPTITNVR